MKQNTSLLTFLALLSFMLIMGCSSDSKTLKATPSGLSFGDVNIGDDKEIELTLTNEYSVEVTVSNLALTGASEFAMTYGFTTPVKILSKASHKITVKFTPSVAGIFEGTLAITHSEATSPKEIRLKGKAIAVARMTLSDTSFDFGSKLINNSHNHDVIVQNNGSKDLNVNSLNISGTGAAAFSITNGNAPFIVTPGATHTFTITFAPTAKTTYAADLSIDHDAVDQTDPFVYSLNGEGVDVDPQITLSENGTWDFGTIPTTMPTLLFVEISNTGSDPLTVSSGALQTSTAFKIQSLRDGSYNSISFPQVLAVGAKIYLWIRFTPTAKTTYNDKLSFVHDGTNASTPLDLDLTGVGRDEIVKTYSFTGASEQFTIPANIANIKVEVYGASGGDGYPMGPNYLGGKGGKVTASFSVTPGVILNIFVGGEGKDGSSTVGGDGGWNGGGDGQFNSPIYCGAGGGGASDIRIGGVALSNRVIVAGGGGGSGNGGAPGDGGGNGGTLIGADGLFAGVYDTMFSGAGGTQTAGGVAGNGGNSQSGALGIGGNATNSDSFPGGGGGGGYYGGGGGYVGGGGGGSSYTNPGAGSVVHTQGAQSGNGEIKIIY